MKNKFFPLIFLLLSLVSLNKSEECESLLPEHLVLNTLNGKVSGSCEKISIFYETKSYAEVDVLSWESIPYAEPPIDELRFKSPKPKKQWSNIIDGTKSPNACIQNKQFATDDISSEDCLYLNIDVPYKSYVNSVIKKDSTALLPIFVWIHGGAFMFGSTNEYDGTVITAASNMIVVRISYRLGVFGFFYLKDTEAQGNQAILDQNLALKWIYENAERFGGNKNRITIAGESAGAWSVGQHLLYKPSWPYFSNAILQSGFPIDIDDKVYFLTPDKASKRFLKAINSNSKFGCSGKTNKDAFECLQSESIDVNELNNYFHDKVSFPIFVKGSNMMTDQYPNDLIEKGDYKKCNVLIGFTDFEQLSLAELNIAKYIPDLKKQNYQVFRKVLQIEITDDETLIDKILDFYMKPGEKGAIGTNYYRYYIDILSDFEYKCSTYKFADMLSKYNDKTYLYEYAHKSSESIYPEEFDGAAHAEELDFVFGDPLSYETFPKKDKIIAEKVVKFWGNFVATGKPSTDDIEWKKYTGLNSAINRNKYYFRYNQLGNKVYSTDDRICKFWNNLNLRN